MELRMLAGISLPRLVSLHVLVSSCCLWMCPCYSQPCCYSSLCSFLYQQMYYLLLKVLSFIKGNCFNVGKVPYNTGVYHVSEVLFFTDMSQKQYKNGKRSWCSLEVDSKLGKFQDTSDKHMLICNCTRAPGSRGHIFLRICSLFSAIGGH